MLPRPKAGPLLGTPGSWTGRDHLLHKSQYGISLESQAAGGKRAGKNQGTVCEEVRARSQAQRPLLLRACLPHLSSHQAPKLYGACSRLPACSSI